jgi:hypothetical protein
MESLTVGGRIALLLTATLLSACGNSAQTSCAPLDKDCMFQALDGHRVQKASFWADSLAKPLTTRIGSASASLVDFLKLENALFGYSEIPVIATLDEAFMADVKGAMAEIPDDVWKLVGTRLAGIYFVEKLGSTGYSGYVRDNEGKPTHAYIVLDAGVLGSLKANAWATWKENTPFKYQVRADDTLSATIEAPEQDNRKSVIQYLLLHELAHVISVGRKLHPEISRTPATPPTFGEYPFFDLSWTVNPAKKQYVSHFDPQWPQRSDVVYYKTAKLPASAMADSYTSLAKTNFPTLYAATVPGDDFAESFASYVHTVRMGKPWSITLQRGGKTIQVFETCWNQDRCAPKRRMLEALLAGA